MNIYTALARQTITDYLFKQKIPEISKLPQELITKRGGCFVTLHNKDDHSLRGCVGTISGHYKNLGAEIIANALEAIRDPRFEPLKKEEIKNIVISVDILGKIEKIQNASEVNPKIYGLIVQKDLASGLLLPDIKGIDTVEKQIEIAKQKANITDDKFDLFRFRVDRFSE